MKNFAKIALNHKIEEVVEIEVEHKIEEVVEIEVEHKIEEVVEIEVEHKIVEEVLATFGDFRPTFGGVLATFGLFCPTLRRFLQAGSTFCGLLAKSLSVDFCTPFLGSIFDPFLVNSQSRICLFYGTFRLREWIFGPFLDRFFTVHFIALLPTLGPCCSSARWLASAYRSCGRREVLYTKGPGWLLATCFTDFLCVARFSICDLPSIFFAKAIFGAFSAHKS